MGEYFRAVDPGDTCLSLHVSKFEIFQAQNQLDMKKLKTVREHTLPSRAINKPIKIHTYHRYVPSSTLRHFTGSSFTSRVSFEYVAANVPHWEGANEGTVNETVAAADSLNEIY